MKITPSILQREFIGLRAKIVASSNTFNIGIKGMITDDSRNTLSIRQGNEEKIIIKDTSIFHVTLPDRQIIEIDGRVLVGRPEDRVKKIARRHW